jgi:hypothetical protein
MNPHDMSVLLAQAAAVRHFGKLPMCEPSVNFLVKEILEEMPLVEMLDVAQAVNRLKNANDYVEAAAIEESLYFALDRLIAKGVKL